MKKILLGILFVSVIWVGYGAYAQEEFTSPEALITDITKVMPTLPLSGQLDKIQLYQKSIDTIHIDSNSKEKLRNYLEQKQEDILAKIEAESLRFSYETLANTNRDNIVDYRLDLHNQVRASKNLAPLTYSKNLEMSAYSRANTIKDEKRTINFHKREEADNNYSNYTSMKEWFANLGIVFNGEWTEFSENVWRGLYNYKTNNLTDEIKKDIQKTFWRFMDEEKSNWAHYRAITSKVFTKIGIGITLDPKTKKYYIVTHFSK